MLSNSVQMFSGKLPFEGVELNELELHLQTGERPSLPADDLSRRRGLSAEMEDLIQDCWTQDPTKRPSADTVVERLQLLPNRPVDQRPVNETGTSFFMQLLSNQFNNPFVVLRREYHWSGTSINRC
jgi:Protein tyrosine and serine/threonine kinase